MTNPDSTPAGRDEAEQGTRSMTTKTGVILIVLSGVLWFSLFAIPFLPLTIGQKAAIAGVDFAAVQFAWWIGAALAGPKLVARLKTWFRKKTRTKADAEEIL